MHGSRRLRVGLRQLAAALTTSWRPPHNPEDNPLITSATLKEYTLKDLAQMAKKRGISGWHSMRKGDLIRALVRDAKAATRKNGKTNGRTATSGTRLTGRNSSATKISKAPVRKRTSPAARSKSARATNPRTARRIHEVQQQQEELKSLAAALTSDAPDDDSTSTDRVVLMVRDPYWLHAHWELSRRSIQRARAAMAECWHTAKPVLRLSEVSAGTTTSSSEVHLRDIEIHGGVNNWYIDVVDPPKGYRVEIGYLATNGRFHALARSNPVVTPRPGSCDTVDQNWNDVVENCERIFALSGGYSPEGSSDELQELLEERLQRPVGSPMVARYGAGASLGLEGDASFEFDVDAEMIIFGSTQADAHVTLAGEPIKVRQDGSFTVRMSLPDRRQVLPVTSSSRDGATQQTIVLAIERNTKVMEAVVRDAAD